MYTLFSLCIHDCSTASELTLRNTAKCIIWTHWLLKRYVCVFVSNNTALLVKLNFCEFCFDETCFYKIYPMYVHDILYSMITQCYPWLSLNWQWIICCYPGTSHVWWYSIPWYLVRLGEMFWLSGMADICQEWSIIFCYPETWARFLCFAWSKLRLCSANHRTGYFSNLACDWLSIVWAYSEGETENGPWGLFC